MNAGKVSVTIKPDFVLNGLIVVKDISHFTKKTEVGRVDISIPNVGQKVIAF